MPTYALTGAEWFQAAAATTVILTFVGVVTWRLFIRLAWVVDQMKANGAARRAGTQNESLREGVDELRLLLAQSIEQTNERIDRLSTAVFQAVERDDQRFAALEARLTEHGKRIDRLALHLREHRHER